MSTAGRKVALDGAGEALQATRSAADRFPSSQHVAAGTTVWYQLELKLFSCIPDISGSHSEIQEVQFYLKWP